MNGDKCCLLQIANRNKQVLFIVIKDSVSASKMLNAAYYRASRLARYVFIKVETPDDVGCAVDFFLDAWTAQSFYLSFLNVDQINEENSKALNQIREDISEIKNSFAYQREILDKLVGKLLPNPFNLNILPFKNLDEVKNADIYLASHSQRDLISYVQSIVGTTSIRKALHFIFEEEAVLHVNWDGRQKKFAVKTLKFFTEVLFFAVNGPKMSLATYEMEMKAGFRSFKNRYYRNLSMKKSSKAKEQVIPEELIIIYLGVLAKRAKILERRRMMKHLRDTNDPFSMEEAEFVKTFRFPKSLCRELIQELEPHDDRKSILPFAIRFLSILYFYSHGSYQNSVGNNYTIPLSQASVSRSLELMSRLLISVKGGEIVFPQSEAELEAVKTGFFETQGIQGTIGAIDCTHIGIATPPAKDVNNPQKLYLNLDGFYSIYVQAVCDHRFRFTHMNSKFPGSYKDSDIWTTSSLRNHLMKTYNLEKDAWLLGGLGYPLEPWLLTPVAKPTNQKEHDFNKLHAKAHSSIEMTFGILKSRFRCLSSNHRTLHYSHEKAANITYACAILHNILINNNIPYDTEEVSRQITRLQKRKQIKNTTEGENYDEGQRIRNRLIDSLSKF